MRILVVDDSPVHQQSARQTLVGHDLAVAGSYDAAQRLLCERHEFEAVLCDLLIPASGHAQGDKGQQFVGQEMPVGIFLALLAAKNGAKYVAVFTDSNHHQHPASACFDAFNPNGERSPVPFTVDGAKVILSNYSPMWLLENGGKNWGSVLACLLEG